MIYLTTGANGAGKTLNTLKLVREKQVAEGRSVFYNGFAMDAAKAAEFGWQEFDPKDWQALPDGAILICDECQNEFPVRSASAPLPEYIRALSEHRRRGFDFFMITQHPQNIDMFVRRLIGSPGWHRHIKRTFGANMVSLLEWSAVNPGCEKDGSGKNARVSMVAYPKEVYSWYASASLHTGKKRIPRQVYYVVVFSIAAIALIWFSVQSLTTSKSGASATPTAAKAASAPVPRATAQLTQSEFVASYQPRIPGLPETAPRYDEVTKPTVAPYPAACVAMGNRCLCYTQQGTKLQTPMDMCKQIVASGFFIDWGEQPKAAPQAPAPVATASAAPAPATVAVAAPAKLTGGNLGPDTVGALAMSSTAASDPVRDGQALASMRIGKRLVQSN
ncbi:MAG: zonular occludens toxin domain-containing protein [Pseudomonadota bacterium]